MNLNCLRPKAGSLVFSAAQEGRIRTPREQ